MELNTSQEKQFLTPLINQKIPVSIFLKNGIKLTGVIMEMDSQVLIMRSATLLLIYKDAISTISPGINITTTSKSDDIKKMKRKIII